jgi:hypothetical protein
MIRRSNTIEYRVIYTALGAKVALTPLSQSRIRTGPSPTAPRVGPLRQNQPRAGAAPIHAEDPSHTSGYLGAHAA